LARDDDLIDWDEDEFDKEAQKSNRKESNGRQASYFQKFLLIRLLTSLH